MEGAEAQPDAEQGQGESVAGWSGAEVEEGRLDRWRRSDPIGHKGKRGEHQHAKTQKH